MEIQEVNDLRPLLFEVLEQKAGQLYYRTRSRKNVEEIREYVQVILALVSEYAKIHLHDFRLRKKASKFTKSAKIGSPIQYLLDSCNVRHFKSIKFSDDISNADIKAVRNWVNVVFNRILEIHCYLEELNYREEHAQRYAYIRGMEFLIPNSGVALPINRKSNHGRTGGRSFVGGDSGFGSVIHSWSGEFRANKWYECINCPEPIRPGNLYKKELLRFDKSIEVLRYHVSCPDDPDDRRDREDDYESGSASDSLAA